MLTQREDDDGKEEGAEGKGRKAQRFSDVGRPLRAANARAGKYGSVWESGSMAVHNAGRHWRD